MHLLAGHKNQWRSDNSGSRGTRTNEKTPPSFLLTNQNCSCWLFQWPCALLRHPFSSSEAIGIRSGFGSMRMIVCLYPDFELNALMPTHRDWLARAFNLKGYSEAQRIIKASVCYMFMKLTLLFFCLCVLHYSSSFDVWCSLLWLCDLVLFPDFWKLLKSGMASCLRCWP